MESRTGWVATGREVHEVRAGSELGFLFCRRLLMLHELTASLLPRQLCCAALAQLQAYA